MHSACIWGAKYQRILLLLGVDAQPDNAVPNVGQLLCPHFYLAVKHVGFRTCFYYPSDLDMGAFWHPKSYFLDTKT